MAKLGLVPILIIVASFGIFFFIMQMLIPVIQGRMAIQEQETFDARFFGYGSSQTITANFTNGKVSQGNNSTELLKQALSSCSTAYLDLIYERGRTIIAIDVRTEEASCPIAIRHYAGGVSTNLDCVVPTDELAEWVGWNATDSADVSRIQKYCRTISSFNVGEIIPLET